MTTLYLGSLFGKIVFEIVFGNTDFFLINSGTLFFGDLFGKVVLWKVCLKTMYLGGLLDNAVLGGSI